MTGAHSINRKWALVLALILPACGKPTTEEKEPGPIRVSWPDTDRQGFSDADLPPFALNEVSFIGSGRLHSTYWLDFEGATVTAQQSFIVKNAGLNQVVVPAFTAADIGSTQDRETVKLELVQQLVTLFADVDIKLTLTKPLTDDFSRVHIGGTNFTGKPRVVGIAPLDLGNRSGTDILFIYAKDLLDQGTGEQIKAKLAHVIAHEIAHSLGARHIDNNKALMRPAVALDADTFNVAGPLVDAPQESENSLQVLLMGAGSRSAAFNEQRLPEIVNLDAFASGGVIQYTVISRENFVANPGLNLNSFRYIWQFDGRKTEGSSVLMSFADKADHDLELTVADRTTGKGKVFRFLVGRRS